MSDPMQQYQILVALYALNGVVWVGTTLSAYMGYRAFRQRVDLHWAIAFALLAAVFFGHAYVAHLWTEAVGQTASVVPAVAEVAVSYQLWLAGAALVPSFFVFHLFRNRRRSY